MLYVDAARAHRLAAEALHPGLRVQEKHISFRRVNHGQPTSSSMAY